METTSCDRERKEACTWWKGLSEEGRWALVTSLYRAVSVAQEERKSDDNPTTTGANEERAAAAEMAVARLTRILEAGESRWETRFMDAQRAARESARASADNSAQLRSALTLLQEDNARLRTRLEEKEAARALRAREEAHSALKGQRYEDDMAAVIKSTFPGGVYTDTSGTPHAGDGMLFAPEYGAHKCMFEFKCHTRPVREVEVTKLARDLDSSRASFAIMMTRSVNVVGRRDFDVERTPVEGKPILFLVRTDECVGAVSALLRQAMRFLTRLVTDSKANCGVDMTALAHRFTRTARTLRTAITKFDQQWGAMRTTLIESLDDLKSAVTPDIGVDGLRSELESFDDRTDLVSVDEILTVLRNRHPNTTKRKLVRLLRQTGEDCCTVQVLRPDHERWNELCGPDTTLKSATYVSFKA